MEISKIEEFLESEFKGAYLVSFGIQSQFIKLGFNNNLYDDIFVDIDCNFYSNDDDINKKVEGFKSVSNDTYKLIYFIYLNRLQIKSVNMFGLSKIVLKFENSFDLIFELKNFETLSFSFIPNYSLKENRTIVFRDNMIEPNSFLLDYLAS